VRRLDFGGDARLRRAAVPGARWLTQLALWRPLPHDALLTGDEETAAVLLSGTFDLSGGGTPWPARGARSSVFEGRPMAVFLPPRTRFGAERGDGEILMVSARQPVLPEATGRESLAKKPLLPLAGSGKAFDPAAGEWRPAETFPTAPESLPPRRMERVAVGELVVERVMAEDYKAATLSVDEVVMPPGAVLRVDEVPGRPRADEVVVFVRTEGAVVVEVRGERWSCSGEGACVVDEKGDGFGVVVAAAAGRCCALLGYAGKG